MEDTLLKVLNIPIATSGNPLGEYTHINNIIGPAIGVGGTIYNLVTLKSTNFHHLVCSINLISVSCGHAHVMTVSRLRPSHAW